MTKNIKRITTLLLALFITLSCGYIYKADFNAKSETVNLITDGEFAHYSTKKIGTKTTVNGLTYWNYNNNNLTGNLETAGGTTNCYLTNNSNSSVTNLTPKTSISIPKAGYYVFEFDAKISGSANITVTLTQTGTSGKTVSCASETLSGINSFTRLSYRFFVADQGSYYFCFSAGGFTSKLAFDNLGLYYDGYISEALSVRKGASIRLKSYAAGLRFQGSVDKTFFDSLKSEFAYVDAGMIIAPTDFLNDCEFTYEALTAAKQVQIIVAEKWNNSSTATSDGYYGFYCVLDNIKPYNVDRGFSARSFVRYRNQNTDAYVYLYSDYDAEDNSRSVYWVAARAWEEKEKYPAYQSALYYYCNMIEFKDFTPDGENSFSLTVSGVDGYFMLEYDANEIEIVSFKINGTEKSPEKAYRLTSDNTAELFVSVNAISGNAIENGAVICKTYENPPA